MKKLTLGFLILLFNGCSSPKPFEFSGNWDLVKMFRDNNEISLEGLYKMSTTFHSDNLVFYYNTLMYYEVENDSLFLFEEETKQLARAFKYEILADGKLSLKYIRKMRADSTTIIDVLYESRWKQKVD